MITGEHAVVYGHPAVVCAIEARVTVQTEPLQSGRLDIASDIGEPESYALSDWPGPVGQYRFVLACFEQFQHALPGGASVTITSDIDPTLGLGSSAAVTIACLGAFARMAGDDTKLHTQALSIIRSIQGRGSGADLAASLRGGMLRYQLPVQMIEAVSPGSAASVATLPAPPPLSLCYSGYKTPTGEVLAKIAAIQEGQKAAFDALYARMGASAQTAISAAEAQDWVAFGAELTAYQGMMAELGVSDATLDRLVADGHAHPGTLAAKISGSGLGDCVLAVGEVPRGFKSVPLAVEGLLFHD